MAHTEEMLIHGVMTPVTVFNSSAQEIDDTVGKTKHYSGDNLLINSVFTAGALVDQRQGYLIPPGSPYSISGSDGTIVGTTDRYYRMDRRGIGPWKEFYIDGTLFATSSEVVRGYTGVGYGIDRFKSYFDSTLLIKDDCVELLGVMLWGTRFIACERGFFPGKTFTFSALCDNPNITLLVWSPSLGDFEVVTPNYNAGLCTYTFEIPNGVLPTDEISIAVRDLNNEKTRFVAWGLEQGTEQTLVRNEGTKKEPVWVLSEIPDYDETLRKCQRYQEYVYWFGNADSRGVFEQTIPYKVTKRTWAPSTAISRNGTVGKASYFDGTVWVDFDIALEAPVVEAAAGMYGVTARASGIPAHAPVSFTVFNDANL